MPSDPPINAENVIADALKDWRKQVDNAPFGSIQYHRCLGRAEAGRECLERVQKLTPSASEKAREEKCPNMSCDPEVDKYFDTIAVLCGCPAWDYPGQIVRDVEGLKDRAESAERKLAVCVEALKKISLGNFRDSRQSTDEVAREALRTLTDSTEKETR